MTTVLTRALSVDGGDDGGGGGEDDGDDDDDDGDDDVMMMMMMVMMMMLRVFTESGQAGLTRARWKEPCIVKSDVFGSSTLISLRVV